MRRTWPLPGGIHPPENKAQSLREPIRDAGIPPQLVLPLNQHLGAAAEPVVEIGDKVLTGQLLARARGAFSAAVHASSSGTVSAIEDRPIPHPSGLAAPCIVIDTDGEDRWVDHAGVDAAGRTDRGRVLDAIRAAGIVGLGGAGFPSAVKLDPAPGRRIHTLILNGTECEPYITADHALMRERAAEIVAGTRLIADLLEVDTVLVGIEDNKPDAIEAMQRAADDGMDVVVFPTMYPSGGEKQLIQILTGQEVPSGGLPAELGIVCHNTGTAYAVYRAVVHGEPLISRITTLTGDAFGRPGNVEVRLGTPIRFLLEQADCDQGAASRLVMGGPMMGIALQDAEAPVIKTTNCLLVPTRSEMPPPPPAQPCIRCGLCAEACPVSLLPQQLFWYAQAKDYDALEEHKLFDCIECGACAWICPSSIPLVQYYRASKATMRQLAEDQQRAEVSRARFEAHQARIEREAAEKEARRRERAARAAAKTAGGDDRARRAALVEQAVARVKAKQAPPQAAPLIEAAVDKVAESSLARQDRDLQPIDPDDPAAAAIARAQARRAGQGEQDGDARVRLLNTVESTARKLEKAQQKLAAAREAGDTQTVSLPEDTLPKLQQRLDTARAELAASEENA
jgi:electron transport complex protein RnfC